MSNWRHRELAPRNKARNKRIEVFRLTAPLGVKVVSSESFATSAIDLLTRLATMIATPLEYVANDTVRASAESPA